MTIIEINKKLYNIPTAWNELSQVQLLGVMDCLFMKQYTGDQQYLKLLKILCNMNYWQFFHCKPTEMEEFFYLTEFLLAEQTGLTKNLLPEYKGLYGPDDDFDNILMKELTIADAKFIQWTEDRENVSLLNELCGLLYRPSKKNYDHEKNPDGDPREPINQNLCEWRAKNIISSWPMNVKLAIVYWYDGCRWKLVDDNPDVFGGVGSGDPSPYGLVAVMLSVAEVGALGDFTSVENHYAKTVMIQLNESIRKAKEQENAMKV